MASLIETITGQFVVDGFWDKQLPGWLVKAITLVPSVVVIVLNHSNTGTFTEAMHIMNNLMILQLPFALIPIIGK